MSIDTGHSRREGAASSQSVHSFVIQGVHLFVSQKGNEQRVDSVFHRSPSEKGDDDGVDMSFHSLDDLS